MAKQTVAWLRKEILRDANITDMDTRILEFYAGHGVDGAGRDLPTILNLPDKDLEALHNYIQWLFPMAERSAVVPSAPVVDSEIQSAFHKDPGLRATCASHAVECWHFTGCRVGHGSPHAQE